MKISRDWFDSESEHIYKDVLPYFLSEDMINHTIYLIEKMDAENDNHYKNRILHMIGGFCDENKSFLSSGCSASDTYDAYHEFIYYLEGWIWKTEKAPDVDCGTVKIIPLKE